MDGQVANDLNFDKWLTKKAKQDPKFPEKALGKGRAELWAAGQITMTELTDQNNRPLTVKQLTESVDKNEVPEETTTAEFIRLEKQEQAALARSFEEAPPENADPPAASMEGKHPTYEIENVKGKGLDHEEYEPMKLAAGYDADTPWYELNNSKYGPEHELNGINHMALGFSAPKVMLARDANGTVVGVIGYKLKGKELSIEYLGGIKPGAGTQLLAKVMAKAKKAKATVSVVASDGAAPYYEKFGFTGEPGHPGFYVLKPATTKKVSENLDRYVKKKASGGTAPEKSAKRIENSSAKVKIQKLATDSKGQSVKSRLAEKAMKSGAPITAETLIKIDIQAKFEQDAKRKSAAIMRAKKRVLEGKDLTPKQKEIWDEQPASERKVYTDQWAKLKKLRDKAG